MSGAWLARLEPGSPPELQGTATATAERGAVRAIVEGTVFGAADPAGALLDAHERGTFAALRGRFAAVLWDDARGELLALRDPIGVLPLFHARAGGALLLSPSMRTLLAAPGVEGGIDPLYVAGQMVLGLSSRPDETAFPAVRRLPAGHLLRSRGGAPIVERYWDLPPEGPLPPDVHERFAALVEQAVLRCQGDGRAAVFLSGGIDSALVAAASARAGAEPPLALAILNPTPEADEERTQRAVAAALGLEIVAVAPDDVVPPGEILTRSLALSPPPAWPAGALQSVGDELMRLARERGCSAVLDGSGGDEWLLPFASLASERLVRLDARALRDMRRAWAYLFPEASPRELARDLVWGAGLRPIAQGAVRRALPAPLASGVRARSRGRAAARLPDWLMPGQREQLAAWWIERFPRGPMFGMHRAEKRHLLVAPFSAALMESHVDSRARTGIGVFSPLWDADLVAFLASLPQPALVAGGRAKALALDYLRHDLDFADRWPGKTYGDSVVEAVLRREGEEAFRSLDEMPMLASHDVVDVARLRQIMDIESERQKLAIWDVLSAEGWVRTFCP